MNLFNTIYQLQKTTGATVRVKRQRRKLYGGLYFLSKSIRILTENITVKQTETENNAQKFCVETLQKSDHFKGLGLNENTLETDFKVRNKGTYWIHLTQDANGFEWGNELWSYKKYKEFFD